MIRAWGMGEDGLPRRCAHRLAMTVFWGWCGAWTAAGCGHPALRIIWKFLRAGRRGRRPLRGGACGRRHTWVPPYEGKTGRVRRIGRGRTPPLRIGRRCGEEVLRIATPVCGLVRNDIWGECIASRRRGEGTPPYGVTRGAVHKGRRGRRPLRVDGKGARRIEMKAGRSRVAAPCLKNANYSSFP